ncbi:hypothetical protein M433DRAFT_149504 [Acidomyces richmondensis BFW]|uniref:uncharacterized protein n=1 Tax=Penicillium brevicompactum TaxID=5074 RepID=UPI0007929D6D|nr:uncharacterized protein N7506_005762 [Penicillium brevicompactum]KAJ5335826.1 hypothetical protein N7506_005762 [Penicillium brevicompactum]KXL41568.1 MAG: hypothetical protein FE78DRAFT_94638 [Acidomyces sp. 'richmondensis']KYG49940.1 hypothetical protein M433DRAFT_149504 [Acidomyces richmondensis BFW]
MSDHQYEFSVQMGCGGCSNTIQGALENLPGLKSLAISLEEQSVVVVAEPSLSYEAILETIKGKGKTVRSGQVDGVPRPV